MSTNVKLQEEFKKVHNRSQHTEYQTAGERMSLDAKLKTLEQLGREDLISLFKDFVPVRNRRKKRTTPPLDQRITLAVSTVQRQKLESELRSLRHAGEKVSMAQYVRNKCIQSPDIQQWATIAKEQLRELDDTEQNKPELEKQRLNLALELENSDEEDVYENAHIINKLNDINRRLTSLTSVPSQLSHRLSGRMTAREAQIVRYRADRLCLTVSDYLRLILFDMLPGGAATQHLTLDNKRRFFVSIVEVAENGFGDTPEVYNCSSCQGYLEEIHQLRQEIDALRALV